LSSSTLLADCVLVADGLSHGFEKLERFDIPIKLPTSFLQRDGQYLLRYSWDNSLLNSSFREAAASAEGRPSTLDTHLQLINSQGTP
jgi:hypothetical protein